jgi:hypothetical protein
MAFNNSLGSFMNLRYDYLTTINNICHESIHAISRNSTTGVSGFHTSKYMIGFNECVTEYLNEVAMEDYHTTHVKGYEDSCDYRYGVSRLKTMIECGIFSEETLEKAYFENDVSYIQDSIEALGGDFQLFMDKFYTAIQGKDVSERKQALSDLDKMISELSTRKNGGM